MVALLVFDFEGFAMDGSQSEQDRARLGAAAAIQDAIERGLDHTGHARLYFETIYNQLGELLSQDTLPGEVMTETEATEWARRTTIDFGKHRGKAVKDAPEKYLRWYDSQPFAHDLRRYIRFLDEKAAGTVPQPPTAHAPDTQRKWSDEQMDCPFEPNVGVYSGDPVDDLDREYQSIIASS